MSQEGDNGEGPAHFPMQIFKELPLEPTLSDLVVLSYEGERNEEDDRFEGYGIARFRSGDEYAGNFHLGLMEGQGKYTWEDGTVFEGEFHSNEIEGSGVYTWTDESTYTGEVREGLRHGNGVFVAKGGFPKYEGEWKAGKRHGKGTLWYDAEGKSYYEGEWANNKRHGQGKIVYVSGNTYEGAWREDKKSGYGVMQWFKLRERYAGEWAEDRQQGFGEHVWMDDKPAEGSLGVMKQMCNIYRGEWLAGKRHGDGVFLYSNGARYSGQWANNVKEGFGVFVFEDGHMYEGPFKQDKMAEPPASTGPRNDDVTQLQLYVDVLDILPCAACDVNAEIHRLEKLALQYNTELKKIYKQYSKEPGDGLDTAFTMSIKQFKRLCRDAKIIGELVSISTIDAILYRMRRHHYFQMQSVRNRRHRNDPNRGRVLVFDQQQHQQVAREDFQTLLFREFFEALVRLAFHIYANEAPELSLAQAAKRLMLDRIQPYLIVPHQQPSGPNRQPPAPPQPASEPTCPLSDEQVASLFARYADKATALATRRAFLRLLRDAKVLDAGQKGGLIPFADAVQALLAVSNQFGRQLPFLEEGGDMTLLSGLLTPEEFQSGIMQVWEDLGRRDKLKEIGGANNEAAAPPSRASEFKNALAQLLVQE